MSNNYQPHQFGYTQNINTNPSPYNQNNPNTYQSLGYGNDNHSNQNINPQIRYDSSNPNAQTFFNRIQLKNDINQFQSSINGNKQTIQYNSVNQNTYNSFNQNNRGICDQPNSNLNLKYNQSQNISNPIFGNLIQQIGTNQITQQMNNLSITPQVQQGLNLWADLAKIIDWDTLLKKKNTSKKQNDTSWVTYQEQSWLQKQPSRNIQIQTDRKFSFPNPYIKYKIIPGVDQKMALDVTAKDNLQKGYIKGNLIIWDYHGGPNQQFYIHRCSKLGNQQGFQRNRAGEDQFILINAATGFVVSAISLNVGSNKKENKICVYPKMKDNRNQRWRLRPIKQKSDIFTIESVDTGKVLDCENGSRSNGTNIIQWMNNGQKNQMWKILPA